MLMLMLMKWYNLHKHWRTVTSPLLPPKIIRWEALSFPKQDWSSWLEFDLLRWVARCLQGQGHRPQCQQINKSADQRMMRHPSHVTCYAFNYLFFHTIEPAHWDDEVVIADFAQYLLCEEKQIGAWPKSFNLPVAAFQVFATPQGFFASFFHSDPSFQICYWIGLLLVVMAGSRLDIR